MKKKKNREERNNKLSYQNEEDRAYGLAGMAISLAAWNALDRLASVSLDNAGPMVTFSGEYYFTGSQTVSPKSTWHGLVENFQLTSAMIMSNIFSRRMVHERMNVAQEELDILLSEMAAEGKETCSLDEDEVIAIYSKTLGYTRRIFSNTRLYPSIRDFVGTLAKRRTMSGGEVRDELHMLQLI